jgi:hypothetical protein
MGGPGAGDHDPGEAPDQRDERVLDGIEALIGRSDA